MESAELVTLIRSSDWLMRVLAAVRDERLPDAWVGAGVLRDLVWDERFSPGFRPDAVLDVDVVFFDESDLSRAHDDAVIARLQALGWPGVGVRVPRRQPAQRPTFATHVE